MTELTINAIETDADGGAVCYLTCVPHEVIFENGLIGEIIIGQVISTTDELTPDNVRINSLFRKTLSAFSAQYISNGLQNEARRQGTGWVYHIDQRTPTPEGEVGSEDIIGGYEVTDGQIVGYQPNPNHLLLSTRGFFNLGKEANSALVNFLCELLIAKQKI